MLEAPGARRLTPEELEFCAEEEPVRIEPQFNFDRPLDLISVRPPPAPPSPLSAPLPPPANPTGPGAVAAEVVLTAGAAGATRAVPGTAASDGATVAGAGPAQTATMSDPAPRLDGPRQSPAHPRVGTPQ